MLRHFGFSRCQMQEAAHRQPQRARAQQLVERRAYHHCQRCIGFAVERGQHRSKGNEGDHVVECHQQHGAFGHRARSFKLVRHVNQHGR